MNAASAASLPDPPSPAAAARPAAPVRMGRLQSIEIARGIASAWVLFFHSLAGIPAESLHPVLRAVRAVTGHGWLGVDIFFALSGWCIADRIATAWQRRETSLAFLRERVLRIYPTYWAALGLLLVARVIALPFNRAAPERIFPVGARGWLGDFLLINPYLDAPAVLIVSWSLVFELGFYALAAAALAARRRRVASGVLVGAAQALCLWPRLGVTLRATYVLQLWPLFFAGVWAWWCAQSRHPWRAAFGAAGFVFIYVAGGGGPDSNNVARAVAVLTAALLWLAVPHDRMAGTFLPLRVLARVGVFSYSLYLVHVTVLSPFLNLAQRFVPPSNTTFILCWTAAVAAAFGAGWILHHCVEAPAERWRKARWRARPAESINAT